MEAQAGDTAVAWMENVCDCTNKEGGEDTDHGPERGSHLGGG